MHTQGNYVEAEREYREILLKSPESFEPRQLLAALLVQTERSAQALPLLETLHRESPNSTQVLTNLGTAHSRLGNPPKATEYYVEALKWMPSDVGTRSNLATSLVKQKRYEEAALQLELCLQTQPTKVSWLLSLGSCQNKLKRLDEAKASFRKILELEPFHSYAVAGLGQLLLKDHKDPEEATACWQKLLETDDSNPAYWNNLASALRMQKRLEDAEQACLRALAILPNFFQAKFNLGMILLSMMKLEEARDWLIQAADFETQRFEPVETANPKHAKYAKVDDELWIEYGSMTFNQLAVVENALGNTDQAWINLNKCLSLRPDYADAELMQAFLHLQVGDFEKGWPLYESRCRGTHAPRSFPAPRWDGSMQADKTLLIHAEQGLGDSIMFIRYAALAKQSFRRVLFLSHKAIVKLVQSCKDVDEVIPDGEPLPGYDFQIPLMSLPGVLESNYTTIPRNVPYLHVSDLLIQQWHEKLKSIEGFRIGIAWQGNPEFANDQFRRVPLGCYKTIADIPGVQLISLQQGHGLEQLDTIDFQVHRLTDVDKVSGAFVDTAAIMRNLDLVISSCTATPHLAGALGVPIWLAKSLVCEWRWMSIDQPENPWYPTMTMFRQPTLGDWTTVFERMRERIETQLLPSRLQAF